MCSRQWSQLLGAMLVCQGFVFDFLASAEGDAGFDEQPEFDEDEEQQVQDAGPAQMTAEWWDLHYAVTFRKGNISSDPRVAGDPKTTIFGNDLNDRHHFAVALGHADRLLRPAVDKAQKRGAPVPQVLVIGCGLSPLVFALADRRLGSVTCLEISDRLVQSLRDASSRVPHPPRFYVGDVTLFGEGAPERDSCAAASSGDRRATHACGPLLSPIE
eukprot:TRINITY_DN18761_c0_g1_i1.p2 TRINITY_DN18761_c0_g1~~TRINITY_DN18761_c0_g1_i1.p2  ORF type:complete len:215 (+),score=32.23 TRINITY_DN18761_c0_g1_i1:67-711(+)